MHRHRWTLTAAASVLLATSLLAAAPAEAVVAPLAKVNFQPAASAVPGGYTADTGAAVDAARGSRWGRPGSPAGSHGPLGPTPNPPGRGPPGGGARPHT